MRLIGITQRVVVHAAYAERRDALDQRWASFLGACGLTAVALPNHVDQACALASSLPLRGVLFTGGNDLCEYGGDAPERDETESALYRFAIERDLPLVGVCRGMQVIQHLNGVRLERVEGHVTARHRVRIDGVPVDRNSYHRFGARTTSASLAVWATADDGVIEAVRQRDRRVTAIMWHPERASAWLSDDIALFKEAFP